MSGYMKGKFIKDTDVPNAKLLFNSDQDLNGKRFTNSAEAVLDSDVPILSQTAGGGSSSSRAFNERKLTSDEITAGEIEMNTVPPFVLESADGGFNGRSEFGKILEYDGYYWMIQGSSVSNIYESKVSRSVDGVTWEDLSTNISGRLGHCTAVFDGKMWILGGTLYGNNNTDDVYSSTDGETWTPEATTPGWAARGRFACWVYDSKIWIAGGNGSSYYKDVWNSSDGATWSEVTDDAGWTARGYMGYCTFDGKMWLAGGWNGSSYYNTAYSSTDGDTWTQESSGLELRLGALLIEWDEKLWYLCGYYNNQKQTVQYSEDGATWGDDDDVPFAGIYSFGGVVVGVDLVVLGGKAASETIQKFVYSREPFVPFSFVAAKTICHLLQSLEDTYSMPMFRLRNQARAIAGATSDFKTDGSKIVFKGANLSAIPVVNDILLVEEI